jgi:hypothetical protein
LAAPRVSELRLNQPMLISMQLLLPYKVQMAGQPLASRFQAKRHPGQT